MRTVAFAIFVVAVLHGLHRSTSWFMRLGRIGGDKIAKGTQCTWWDEAHKVAFYRQGKTPIPCCPYCFTKTDAIDGANWWRDVDAHGASNYRKFVERSRGMCFPSQLELADHLTIGQSPLTMMRD